MQLVLNEMSVLFPVENRYQAQKVMQDFLSLYHKAKCATGSDNIYLNQQYNYILLAEGYNILQWRNDSTVDREYKRMFNSLLNQSLLYDSVQLQDDADFEVHDSGYSVGCQLAYELSGCCFSFPSQSRWDVSAICGIYRSTNESTGQLDELEVSIPNIASAQTLETFQRNYQEHIHREEMEHFTTGIEILRHTDKFPNLFFCQNAKRQLEHEQGLECISQIARRLRELQDYFQAADGNFNSEKLSHCTPESQMTLQKYGAAHSFRLPNGEEQLFSWHVRFTGEYAGRIFFHPDMDKGICYIGHIGKKLPTVKFPT